MRSEEEVVAELNKRLKALEGAQLVRDEVESKVKEIIHGMIEDGYLGPGFLHEIGVSVTLDKDTGMMDIEFYERGQTNDG